MSQQIYDSDECVVLQAYGHLNKALNVLVGELRCTYSDSLSNKIFLALETALLQHAARIAVFRAEKFGANITTDFIGRKPPAASIGTASCCGDHHPSVHDNDEIQSPNHRDAAPAYHAGAEHDLGQQ